MCVLKWARDNDCPWDSATCSEAAGSENLDMLQWGRFKKMPWDGLTCSKAAEGGHFGLLQWARSYDCSWGYLTCQGAAAEGNLEVLQWARAIGAVWGAGTIRTAPEGGHLEVLQWARAGGLPWHSQACVDDIRSGTLIRSSACWLKAAPGLGSLAWWQLFPATFTFSNGCGPATSSGTTLVLAGLLPREVD